MKLGFFGIRTGAFLAILVTIWMLGSHSTMALQVTVKTYPEAPRGKVSEDYHGTAVADPYRWLEDPDSKETTDWVKKQVKLTDGVLAKMPQRQVFRKRLTELWNYQRYGIPTQKEGFQLYTFNNGLQNQSVLMMQPDGMDAEVLLDPNKWSDSGTATLAGTSVSPNGKLLAYSVGIDGSDWREIKILDIESRKLLADKVRWMKFSSVSWTKDNNGFFYSRYETPAKDELFTAKNEFHKIYYHTLGTDQSEDQLIYQRKDHKDWGFDTQTTEDGRYAVINVWKGTLVQNQVFVKDLSGEDSKVVEFRSGYDAQFSFLGNDGETFYFLTDWKAPLRRIVAIKLGKPQEADWKELVPEAKEVIQSASMVGNSFLVSYLKNASSAIRHYKKDGQLVRAIQLPGIGTASGFGGRRKDDSTYYSFSSFTNPGAIYRYDLASGESKLVRSPKVKFDPDRFETKQKFFQSKDGTKVPVFIVKRKDVKTPAPTILYGYGGFDISITPSFSVPNLAWVEAGGIYAVATLRGGGEYGQAWHEAGMLGKKQNVFDDFIGAAEHLIETGVTSKKQISIYGRSNGGLLVGAAMTQRPDLFASAVPAVGVLDMLRFHKFTIGHAWTPEYGCAEKKSDFPFLRSYSPLHNLRPGAVYPPTLVMTADHDDRVVPAHSFKFAAELQYCQKTGAPPVMIRIETKGGHGAGKPVSMQIDEAADRMGFQAFYSGWKFN